MAVMKTTDVEVANLAAATKKLNKVLDEFWHEGYQWQLFERCDEFIHRINDTQGECKQALIALGIDPDYDK